MPDARATGRMPTGRRTVSARAARTISSRRFACAAAACWLWASAAFGGPLVVEETFLTVEVGGEPFALEALVSKELGRSSRLPVALITHGQSRDIAQRENVTARAYLRTAREFARRGWLAVVVVRRGFGKSGGAQPYRLRACRNGDYATGLDEQTDDLEAAIRAISRRSDADGSQIVALGVSVGGAAVLNLAARRPEGLRAVVNVSGGIRTSPGDTVTPETCGPEDLLALFAAMGRRSRLPTLWLYAENDSVFAPDYVRQLHEAYVGQGGRTEFHMFDPVGPEGHDMFGHLDGMLRWIPVLDRFLRSHKLTTFDPNLMGASVRQLDLGPSARQAVIRYAGRPTEKALAVSRSNKVVYTQFGGADLDETERSALDACAERAKEPCRIVIRNFAPADDPETKPEGLN
jgi:dienelactone hydrolase